MVCYTSAVAPSFSVLLLSTFVVVVAAVCCVIADKNTSTSKCLYLTVIAQVYENAVHHKFKENPLVNFAWDPIRTMRITVFGGIVTFWLHGWWNFLEKVVEKRISAKTHHYSNALTKVFLDQSLGAPIFNTLFFTSQQLMQGKPCDESLLRTGELLVSVC